MKGCFWLTYYYWNQNNQQQQPFTTNPQFPFPAQTPSQTPNQTQQMTTPAFPSTASMAPAGIPTFTTSAGGARGEESYIENILRLNRGKEAVFSFTIPSAVGTNESGNTVLVRGVVVEAGRDHAVIREFQTDHYYLFPMIYFDYARFEEPITYLRGGSVVNPNARQ